MATWPTFSNGSNCCYTRSSKLVYIPPSQYLQIMASTVNNFSLLAASGGDSASKNSSKKKKPQSASTSDIHHIHVTANGSIPSAVKQQEATRTTVIEGKATLEAVARAARSIQDKASLWREWSKLVSRHGQLTLGPSDHVASLRRPLRKDQRRKNTTTSKAQLWISSRRVEKMDDTLIAPHSATSAGPSRKQSIRNHAGILDCLGSRP